SGIGTATGRRADPSRVLDTPTPFGRGILGSTITAFSRRSYTISPSVRPSEDDPVSACPAVRIWRACLTTVPTGRGCRAWFSPHDRSLFLRGLTSGRAFSRQRPTPSFQGAVPRGTNFSLPECVGWIKTEGLHPTPEGCGLSDRSSVSRPRPGPCRPGQD